MDKVSDVFAFALRHPDLWSGLFFKDHKEARNSLGIGDAEWAALDAARPHLTESNERFLKAAHGALRAKAARSRAGALKRVARARFKPSDEPPWQYVQLYLASSYRASVLFGFSDDLGGAVRPYATLWARYGLRTAMQDAASLVVPGPGVGRLDHHQSVAWHLTTPGEGDRFADLGEAAADLVWPAAKQLCKQLHKQSKGS